MKNLLVIFGGKSGEHEISRRSCASVLEKIRTDNYNIIKIGITKEGQWLKTEANAEEIKNGSWEQLNNMKAILSPDTSDRGILVFENGGFTLIKIDVIFPIIHGSYCEDGCIQGLFELSDIPYVGAGVLASAVGMDKGLAKLVFEKAGIPQADWLVIKKSELSDAGEKIEKKFNYPVFVKPCNAGSSLGAGKVKNPDELMSALYEAAKFDSRILVEEYINAREIECAVLGNENPKASCPGEVAPTAEFYDYDAKYIDNTSELIIPAALEQNVSDTIRSYGIRAYKALGCRGLSRVDFFIRRETGEIYLNEINTLPGFTSISMYPKLWEASGIPYSKLIDELILLAYKE